MKYYSFHRKNMSLKELHNKVTSLFEKHDAKYILKRQMGTNEFSYIFETYEVEGEGALNIEMGSGNILKDNGKSIDYFVCAVGFNEYENVFLDIHNDLEELKKIC